MNKKRVLVVDDEAAFLLSIKRLFDGPEFFIATAESFEAAMMLLKEHDFHIVITDVRLTSMMKKEGLEILQHIKKTSPCTLVIILTAYGSPEIMEKAYSLGADLFMEKPVPLSVLLSIIRNQRRSRWICPV